MFVQKDGIRSWNSYDEKTLLELVLEGERGGFRMFESFLGRLGLGSLVSWERDGLK